MTVNHSKHLELHPTITCSKSNCAHVHGRTAGIQQPIKMSVVLKAKLGENDIFTCHGCQMYKKDHLTIAERKRKKEARKQERVQELKAKTAETT